MAFIIDFLLLSASGAACFYCWILSKRLRGLTSAKDGFHTGIAALSQSAEDMQAAMSKTQEDAVRLETLLGRADEKIPELRALLEQITEITTHAVSETESASKNLVDVLAPHIKEARESAQFLLRSLEQASRETGDQTPSAPPAQEIFAPEEEQQQTDAADEEVEFISVGEDNNDEPQGAAA